MYFDYYVTWKYNQDQEWQSAPRSDDPTRNRNCLQVGSQVSLRNLKERKYLLYGKIISKPTYQIVKLNCYMYYRYKIIMAEWVYLCQPKKKN